jgi:hypothetical protein
VQLETEDRSPHVKVPKLLVFGTGIAKAVGVAGQSRPNR